MTRPLKHFAELTAGSAAEAIMNTIGGGQDGHFFNVPQGEVARIRLGVLDSEQNGGFGRFRIRQDATAAGAGVIPVFTVTDPIFGFFNVPLGAGGVEDVGAQPFELPGLGTADGVNYYITIQQPGGAGFAAVLLEGTVG